MNTMLLADLASGLQQDDAHARMLATITDLDVLMAAARAVRDAGFGDVVTYSRKCFIPLTMLCRDRCHYCTFAKPPRVGEDIYLRSDAVLDIARRAVAAGCHEALFTLGDKPELRWPQARAELEALGHGTTIDYLRAMAELVLCETGLLPHLNPGVMTAADIAALRPVAGSMGLMLEGVSPVLTQPGGAHYRSPDKDPARRLACIDDAGRQNVPFTSGILIGLGESRADRVEALISLRSLHRRHGHLQEVIVQNFQPKPGTKMYDRPAPAFEDHLWTIAVARLILDPGVSLQAPPNLAEGPLRHLIEAGINDWGGISPVTPDHVNPEAPWPHLVDLEHSTEQAGKALVPRLTLYPNYVQDLDRWADRAIASKILRQSDAVGLAREDGWRTGSEAAPPIVGQHLVLDSSAAIDALCRKARDGVRLGEAEIVRLFAARGADFELVCRHADELRAEQCRDEIGYVVTRNINYTNICTYSCRFCAFSKGRTNADLRGSPYDLDQQEFSRRVEEAWARGATEICLQGGIHPDYDGNTYLRIVAAAREAAPKIHIHAFSPLEVSHGASTLGLSLHAYLSRLKAAGLSTLPGTAAEVLDDEVRFSLCKDKLNTAEWFAVMEAAHALDMGSTATIMFGHIERPHHWARHLLRLRAHQERTGGFTEFVPLPFVALEAPIFRKGDSRMGPTWREAVLMHAVSRLVLHPLIRNIQTSWVKMGPQGARAALRSGANDLGGTLMDESITRAAGAVHGQELPPSRMEAIITGIGRRPYQRTTSYGRASAERISASFAAQPLAPRINTALRRKADTSPPAWREHNELGIST